MTIPHPTTLKGHLRGEGTDLCPSADSLLWVATRAKKAFSDDASTEPTEVLHLNKLGFGGLAYQLAFNSYSRGNHAAMQELLRAEGLGGVLQSLKGEREETPPVTVYIPCYNGASYLEETIAAIKHQTHPVQRILLIDDGSTDSTVAIAESLGVEVIKHPNNLGLGAARNSALRAVSSGLVAALDADVAAHPFWLERIVPLLKNRSGVVVGGRLVERYGTSFADRWRSRVMRQHHGREMREGMLIFGCNSVGRATEIAKVGGYSSKYQSSFEDVDFSERFLADGGITVYEPNALCWHHRKDSTSSVIRTAMNWRAPAFDQHGAKTSLTAMCSKWTHTVRGDIQEITALIEEGRWDIAPLSFAHTFASIANDLVRFEWSSINSSGDLRSIGLKLLAASIGNIKGLGVRTRELIARVCRDLFSSNGLEGETAEFFSFIEETRRTGAAELRASLREISDDSAASILFVSLSELGPVLSLPSRYLEQIELGAAGVIQEGTVDEQLFALPLGCYEHGWRPKLPGEAVSIFEWCEMIAGFEAAQTVINIENSNPQATALALLKLAQRSPGVTVVLAGAVKSPLLAEVLKSLPNIGVST